MQFLHCSVQWYSRSALFAVQLLQCSVFQHAGLYTFANSFLALSYIDLEQLFWPYGMGGVKISKNLPLYFRETKFISYCSVCCGEKGTLGVSCITLDFGCITLDQQGNHFPQGPQHSPLPHLSHYIQYSMEMWEWEDKKETLPEVQRTQAFELT